MDPILKRQLDALTYVEPEEILRSIRPVIDDLLQNPERVTHLSGDQKKKYRESYQGAFLAFMVKHMAGSLAKVTLCIKELEDFDCVIKGEVENQIEYKQVQLKCLPRREDSGSELQTIINDAKETYPRSPELIIAVWIDRLIRLDLARLDFTGLGIAQLWFFCHADSGETVLRGGVVSDLLSRVCFDGKMRDGVPHIRCAKFGTS